MSFSAGLRSPPLDDGSDFLAGGGEMGARMRSFEWARTAFGPVSSWPQSLRTALSICLNSRFPIVLWWGPELRLLYNDAWRPVLGRTKHPQALGAPGHEVWPEIWDIIGPMLRGVLHEGLATWSDDQLLMLDRNGYLEEAYFTYSYSPIRSERGDIGGVFSAVNETTTKYIGERRLRTLRELAAQVSALRDPEQAGRAAIETLSANTYDVPFAHLYFLDAKGQRARLVACTRGAPLCWDAFGEGPLGAAPWPLERVVQGREKVSIDSLDVVPERLPSPWPVKPARAVAMPLATAAQDRVAAVLVMGVNPCRELDESHVGFHDLVASHIATSLTNAMAYDEERRRATALEELDKAKTTFFSNVSHELRTPLTLMLGPLGELLAAEPPGSDTRRPLEMCLRNAQRLLKLVNNLLDFSRIEAGRVQATYVPTDLAELTHDLASLFRSAMEKAGLAFEVECAALPHPVCVDRDMWEKIVLNLMSNAFKYTLAGAVRVSLLAEDGRVVLRVSDTGGGIPEDQVPLLFTRFHRVQGTAARTHEGTGIGLALVHELAKLHGGTVSVESRAGEGSTFEVRIPLGREHLPEQRVGEPGAGGHSGTRVATFLDEALGWLGENMPGELDAAEPGDEGVPEPGRDERTVVLLADDNADMRAYVERLLSRRHRVETAADGEEALAKARSLQPDLVLTDVMMPKLDGFQLVSALRSDPALAATPVIMLSARAGNEATAEGLRAGADDYLVKPFGARELVARVDGALALARLRREVARQETRILESVTDAVVRLDGEGRCAFMNQEAERLLGVGREQLLGRKVIEVLPDSAELPAWKEIARARSEGTRVEFESFWRGRWQHSVAYPTDDGAVAVFFRDITEAKQAQEALAQADRRKDEFLAMLAHELRNPLAPLRNALELLRRPGVGAEAQDKARRMMQRQLEHLVRLVDDLMDVGRITRDNLTLRTGAVQLDTLLANVVESARPVAQQHGQTLVIEQACPILVEADEVRLSQVFSNLINNAAKYSRPGGAITVVASVDGHHAVVAVRDTGIGMPPGQLRSVFEMFVQLDGDIPGQRTGLGIGLSIARRIVEMHGGTIEAHSDGPGKGSVFTVRLPLAPAA